ncbi:hypothetical protein AMTRI_Chr04g244080 [Amborella trichopoda]
MSRLVQLISTSNLVALDKFFPQLISLSEAQKPLEKYGNPFCLKSISVNQHASGYNYGSLPQYTVHVANLSFQTVTNVHLNCGNFSSATKINPSIFKRLQPGDCLVNGGGAIKPGEIVAFDYTNILPYSLSLSTADCT